uniref:Uncharacterized protein n=1 Tax=Cyanoderma ruficeps TaxID=181631 RepID=A0A8C3R2Y8_9PASS
MHSSLWGDFSRYISKILGMPSESTEGNPHNTSFQETVLSVSRAGIHKQWQTMEVAGAKLIYILPLFICLFSGL